MAAKKREKPHFESLNELLGAPDVVDGQTEIRIDMDVNDPAYFEKMGARLTMSRSSEDVEIL